MKKLTALFILVFMLSSLLIGCDVFPLPNDENIGAEENGDSTDKENSDITPDSENKDDTKDEEIKEDNTNTENPEDKEDPKGDEEPSNPNDKDEPSNPDDKDEPSSSTDPTEPSDPPVDNPDVTQPPIGTSVGYTFADVVLTGIDGSTINTADFRGKIIVLNLWATWCGPCIYELPHFNEVASEYKDQVVIIAADIDGGYYNSKGYVEQNFPDTDILFAYDTDYNDAYYAAGGNLYVPHTAIIDENGVIRYSDSGALSKSELVSLIEALIN